MQIEFKRLADIDKSSIVDLMNHPLVRRHMPLASSDFGWLECAQFVAEKEQLWSQHGYGPWAFVVNGQFAGWGGLQPENGEADLALVLHPDHWGIGLRLCRQILHVAFAEMGLESVTLLLPPSRTRIKGLLRLGFVQDGSLRIADQRFIRYRKHSHRLSTQLANTL